MGRWMDAIHAFSAPKAERVTETGSFGWCPVGFNGGLFPVENVAAGEMVTPNTALASSAVYASVRVLAETISTLPLKVFQTLPDGGKEAAPNHPLNDVLQFMPNIYQDKVQFWDQGITHMNLRGNMYAEIVSGPVRGFVDELRPIHPDAITKIEKLENGRLRYTERQADGTTRELNQDQVLHIRGSLSQNGITGMSPIEASRQGIGVDIAAEKYSGKFYGNNATPGMVITNPPGVNLDDRGIKNAKQSWINQVGGDNQLSPVILQGGATATPMAMTGRDAQQIETRKFQVSDIARIFRVPPHLIGDLERATFSNIEEMGINFVQYSLVPWLVRSESAMMMQLMSEVDREAGFFIRFIVDGLLRGDIEKRYNSYDVGIRNGILSPNEARLKENLNPREGGDEFVASQNTRPSGGGDAFGADGADGADIRADGTVPATFISDAAKRISNAEIREISKHIKHADGDRKKFDAWAGSYLTGDKHRKYVGQTIEPFGCSEIVVPWICTAIEWSHCDEPIELLATWKRTRADHIESVITEGMNSHDE